ncbi:NADH-quinone oxidoreductase subunit E [Defluviimonas sp. WL0002]|uniref:NADH-quinone oxidoreductase subunit E n=1 Tax=Albidovulum marisflavi TaxID=2984159 RepID=A0ABT2ZFD3_9RHOB|nr:NADH-quinone oxidoreductase subunit E [Defluviimonas sp. WL0002]MCV2869785.1 NADH-quinone oxidoreductase subunit E [Defluviimonas sp. WL0002]
MLRRLHKEQPASFEFTPANLAWAKGQMTKYPEGRQASAVIPLLWRAQEQEGWLSRPAIEYVADMLGMAYIRALEVATFYFMFQLQPVGSVAHIQICGTTSCMICGAEDLIKVCKEKIAATPHTVSADGKFSWEEVECLGACTNAPMAQIGKDYYEDLTPQSLSRLLDDLSAGKLPVPGPQNGRYASEPLSGLTSLKDHEGGKAQYNASVQLAMDVRDGIKRIDGTEVPLLTPWLGRAEPATPAKGKPKEPKPAAGKRVDETGITVQEARAVPTGAPKVSAKQRAADAASVAQEKPAGLTAARAGGADDLKRIKGVGPKLEALLNRLGYYHFDQIAAWSPAEVAWVDENLEGFKGRVSRDGWVEQARALAEDGKD